MRNIQYRIVSVFCSVIFPGKTGFRYWRDSPMNNCICNQYVNRFGFGNCTNLSLKRHKFYGQNICYVNLPSQCPDLSRSVTDNDKSTSVLACTYEDERKTREHLGIPNSLKGNHITVIVIDR